MNDADKLGVTCSECGKRLRVRTALRGKRVKCPSCFRSFEVKADEPAAESGGVAQVAAIQWALIGSAAVAFVLFGLLLFLWLGAESQANGLRDQVAAAEQKLLALEELKTQLHSANRKVADMSKSPERVRQLDGDNAAIKAEITKLTKELAAKKNALVLAKQEPEKPNGAKSELKAAGKHPRPVWLIEDVRARKVPSYTINTNPTVSLTAREGRTLYEVRWKLTALIDDPKAVETHAANQPKTADGKHRKYRNAFGESDIVLDGKYRIFDMKHVAILGKDGTKHEALWVDAPKAEMSITPQGLGTGLTKPLKHWYGSLH